MKNKSIVLIVILIVSICFNLFFVGGYLRTRSLLKQLAAPGGRIELAAKRLELSGEQKKKIIALASDLKAEGERMKERHREEIEAFWFEAIKDEPDTKVIRSLLENAAAIQQQEQAMKISYLLRILQSLNPTQRRQCVKMIREKNIFTSG